MDERYVAKSATRALDILMCFRRSGRPLRAIDISTSLDLPHSSIDQILKSLTASGYLVLSPSDKTYFPSPDLSDLGNWVSCAYSADKLATLLSEITSRTGCFSSARIQNDCHAQIVARASPGAEPPLASGSRYPLFGCAVGAAILINKSPSDCDKLLHRIRRLRHAAKFRLEERVIDTLNYRAALGLIQEFRYIGYAWQTGTKAIAGEVEDVMTIALPLPVPSHNLAMSIGLSGLSREMRGRQKAVAREMADCIDRFWRDDPQRHSNSTAAPRPL